MAQTGHGTGHSRPGQAVLLSYHARNELELEVHATRSSPLIEVRYTLTAPVLVEEGRWVVYYHSPPADSGHVRPLLVRSPSAATSTEVEDLPPERVCGCQSSPPAGPWLRIELPRVSFIAGALSCYA